MSDGLLVLFDAIAVLIMVFCLYFPRHGRKEMIVALFAINIGVLGVSFTLADAAVSAGLGLGLFGVLSIIRLLIWWTNLIFNDTQWEVFLIKVI